MLVLIEEKCREKTCVRTGRVLDKTTVLVILTVESTTEEEPVTASLVL